MPEEQLRTDRRPLYLQAQEALMRRIAGSTYERGQKLQPEEQLALELGVSRTTMRSALGNLEALGYVRRIHGAGTFVAERRVLVDSDLDTVESFHPRLAAKLGFSSRLTHLAIRELCADREVAGYLRVGKNATVTSVRRVIEMNDTPVALLCDYIPRWAAKCTEMQSGFLDSVIEYFDGRPGRPQVAWAESEISAVEADRSLSESLGVNSGEILLRLKETFYTDTDQVVSWSDNYIVPQLFRFHINRRVVRRDIPGHDGGLTDRRAAGS